MSLDRNHRKPAFALPRGAADCHMHVFGPFERYPLAAERAYNVDEAPLEAHERMKAQVGLERTVLVQASGYGMDNRAMLAAMETLGSRGRAVAVVPLGISKDELRSLDSLGVKGIRLNLLTLASRHSGDPSHLLHRYGELVAPLGWHVQVFISGPMLLAMQEAIRGCAAPVVVDHMGLPDATQGLAQPGFQALLQLVQEKHVWAKLGGADRVTRASGRLRDAVPFMRALIDAAPQRLVWGSDWPNLGFHSGTQVHGDEVLPHRELDAGELLDVLAEAVPDAATRGKVLADNPAKLYDF